MLIIIGLLNIAFSVEDLIYAKQINDCVTKIPYGFSFDLVTWLSVDGYTRIGIIGLTLLLVVISSICSSIRQFCTACRICFLCYSTYLILVGLLLDQSCFGKT